ncbi:MAG: hypothetical protein P1S60_15235 [Anaerolineae bacterium]|nr:hypothetical protein [Anaerolineae bacterium]
MQCFPLQAKNDQDQGRDQKRNRDGDENRALGDKLSRSRPYRKNDNRFVEQKNSSLVRAYFGDIRLDTVAQTKALESIYQQLWLFNNCFQPSLRLSAKQTIPADDQPPARIRRHHSARTPWQRICDADVLPVDVRDLLQIRINVTNPRVLRRQIYAALEALYALPAKSSSEPENVHATLSESAPVIEEG